MKETTLLVGSSIRKGVETKDRNGDATVRSFPGTTIQTLKSKLQEYDTDNCKRIILHVGGNDGDNGADMDSFQDVYISLLEILAPEDRRLIVSGLLPRETADLESYNIQLKALCDENDTDFITHSKDKQTVENNLQSDFTVAKKTGVKTTKCIFMTRELHI